MEWAVINKLIYPNYSYVTGCIHGDENASPLGRRLAGGGKAMGKRSIEGGKGKAEVFSPA